MKDILTTIFLIVIALSGAVSALMILYFVATLPRRIIKYLSMKNRSNHKKYDAKDIVDMKWIIETKKRSRSIVSSVIYVFIFIFILFGSAILKSILNDANGDQDSQWMALLAVVVFLFFLFLAAIFFVRLDSARERNYCINNVGVQIRTARRVDQYAWDNFEYFFTVSDIEKQTDPGGSGFESAFSKNIPKGDTYFLKQKPKSFLGAIFSRNLVTIRTNLENQEMVKNEIAKKLKRKKPSQLDTPFFLGS